MRIADDPTLITPVFFNLPQQDVAESKKQGRLVMKDVPHVRIRLAANKQTEPVFPAHAIWKTERRQTEWGGEEAVEVTYAQRFQKQWDEFVRGDKQTFNGTPLAEMTSISSARRLELQSFGVFTVEALAALDGSPLKMLGPGGREDKNAAIAFMEKARKNVDASTMASELSKRDAEIAELRRKLESLTNQPVDTNVSRETIGEAEETEETEGAASIKTIEAFKDFEIDDIKAWLVDGGVTVDNRWGRKRLLKEAEDLLAKRGKQQAAQAA